MPTAFAARVVAQSRNQVPGARRGGREPDLNDDPLAAGRALLKKPHRGPGDQAIRTSDSVMARLGTTAYRGTQIEYIRTSSQVVPFVSLHAVRIAALTLASVSPSTVISLQYETLRPTAGSNETTNQAKA